MPRTTSRSSAASTCATGVATTTSTAVIRRSSKLDDEHYGERPPWHDLQLELHGPVVDDLAWSFAERWRDPNPLDTRNPLRAALHRVSNHPDVPGALPPSRPAPADGPLAVQVLRTYPARRRAYPFAPEGERSIARAYLKAFSRARRLVYLEDQYLWSLAATEALRDALAAQPRAAGGDRRAPLSRSRRRDLRARRAASAASVCSTRSTRSATSASRCTTSRTTRAPRSTCTRRCASSTTSGWRSVPTTSTVVRGRTTPSSRAR